MKIGISSACLFPMLTEEAVETLFKNDVKEIEVFINSPSENDISFVKKLLEIKERYGGNILSVHPCTSEHEGVNFFGRYPRRFDDAAEDYKQVFELTAMLGADIVAFHGARAYLPVERARYFERFQKLSEISAGFGVRLAQENVVNFFSQSPDFIAEMIKEIPDCHMLLDIKQAKRTGLNPFEMLGVMGKNLCHLHLSDHDNEHDCLPMGKGNFDCVKLIDELNSMGYKGALMIELYRKNYSELSELVNSKNIIGNFLKKAQ